jgi:threonine/homoserine/homoserine lactone efflux protein
MALSDQQFLFFITITVVLTITPGADTILVLRNVLRGGFRDGVYTSIGICSGLFVHATLSALGISMILVSSATLFSIVKMFGAGYLIWLGGVSLLSAIRQTRAIVISPTQLNTKNLSLLRSLREGLLSNVLNPKLAVFYLSFFPQFISKSEAVFPKTMCLASIQFVIGVIWLSLLSLIIIQAKALIVKPPVRSSLEGLSGGILIALGLKISLQNN